MDRAVIVLSALLLNAVLGGPRRLYAPLRLSQLSQFPVTLLRDAERKLNREHRSQQQREWRGGILVAAVIVADMLAGWLGGALFSNDLHFVEIILLAALLPVRQTWDLVAQLRRYLQEGNLLQARLTLEGTVWRHYMLLDEYGLARAGIEMLAVHFSEKILAPILWYLLFGLPGFFISKSIYLMVETLTTLSSDRNGRGFKSAATFVHFLIHYVPVRIAAFLWSVAGLFPTSGNAFAGDSKALLSKAMMNGSAQTVSLLSAAGALGISLGGPSSAYANKEWLGTGTVRATPRHLRRALYVFALLNLLLFVLLGIFL